MDQGLGGVAFDPEPLARELLAFGEAEAAELLLKMSPSEHEQISVRAGRLLSRNLTIDKAICLAAVEIFEGQPRELRRKRRVYPKSP
jgi:hypothetical protein